MKKTAQKRVPKPRNAEATRAKILAAAIDEFADRGLTEARTEDIAKACGVNKRLVYYYFGSKEGLYLAALEESYAKLTELEHAIDVDHLEPKAAIAALINLKIDYYIANPHFISFLNMENLYKAKTLSKSKRINEFKTPLTQVISRILERGEKQGIFRSDIEPIDLYISICALGFMYFANQHTLKVIFNRDLMAPSMIAQRRETIIDLILSYLNPANSGTHAVRQDRGLMETLIL